MSHHKGRPYACRNDNFCQTDHCFSLCQVCSVCTGKELLERNAECSWPWTMVLLLADIPQTEACPWTRPSGVASTYTSNGHVNFKDEWEIYEANWRNCEGSPLQSTSGRVLVNERFTFLGCMRELELGNTCNFVFLKFHNKATHLKQ